MQEVVEAEATEEGETAAEEDIDAEKLQYRNVPSHFYPEAKSKSGLLQHSALFTDPHHSPHPFAQWRCPLLTGIFLPPLRDTKFCGTHTRFQDEGELPLCLLRTPARHTIQQHMTVRSAGEAAEPKPLTEAEQKSMDILADTMSQAMNIDQATAPEVIEVELDPLPRHRAEVAQHPASHLAPSFVMKRLCASQEFCSLVLDTLPL